MGECISEVIGNFFRHVFEDGVFVVGEVGADEDVKSGLQGGRQSVLLFVH